MVDIAIAANASDNSGCAVTLNAAVTSNEPQSGLGSGDIGPDWTEPFIDQAAGIIYTQLRAERSGRHKGRIYTITITATDCSDNVSTAKVKIRVPHDKDNEDRKKEDRDERERYDDDGHDRDQEDDDKQEINVTGKSGKGAWKHAPFFCVCRPGSSRDPNLHELNSPQPASSSTGVLRMPQDPRCLIVLPDYRILYSEFRLTFESVSYVTFVAEAPLISSELGERTIIVGPLCLKGRSALGDIRGRPVVGSGINVIVNYKGRLHVPPRHSVPSGSVRPVAGKAHHVGIILGAHGVAAAAVGVQC
jgi:hypothetical protein